MIITLDISNMELFVPKLDFFIRGEIVDLTNQFDCLHGEIDENKLELNFKRKKPKFNNYINHVRIVFDNFTCINIEGQMDSFPFGKSISNLQRVKFVLHDKLHEVASDGRCAYLVEFYEGPSIEFFSSSVKIYFQISEGIV